MEDNDAETKIQLEVLEKEKKNKDQVWNTTLYSCFVMRMLILAA